MKKINLILIGIIFFLNLFAQHTPLYDIVNISLPKESQKFTNDQLQTFVAGRSQYSQSVDRRKSKGDFYKINTMILQLNGAKISTPNSLEDTKKSFDEMANFGGNLSTNYTSEIKNINNYNVLIIHHEGQNYASYNFYSVSMSNTCILNGKLEYDKTDKSNRVKAAKTLEEILKNMTFK